MAPLHTFVISCYLIVWFSLLSTMFNTPICFKIFQFHDVLESAAYVLCHVFHGFKGIVRVSINGPHAPVSADVCSNRHACKLFLDSQALFPAFSTLKMNYKAFYSDADGRSMGIVLDAATNSSCPCKRSAVVVAESCCNCETIRGMRQPVRRKSRGRYPHLHA